MRISETEFDGYQLRMRQGKWYFDLWLGDKDLKLSQGPYLWPEASEYFKYLERNGVCDYDKKLTSRKVDAENTSL